MFALAYKLASSTALTPANDNFRLSLMHTANTTDGSGNVILGCLKTNPTTTSAQATSKRAAQGTKVRRARVVAGSQQ